MTSKMFLAAVVVSAGVAMADDVVVTADFGAVRGKVKQLNGTNAGPSVKKADDMAQLNADFRELGFTSVRLHDIPLCNSGMNLVDVKDIFPIWQKKLDPKDPENYYFAPTDDYLKNIMSNSNAGIVYRLGASIEHGPVKYFARKPDDYARYAEVCAGIVRHYTKGWANGFKAPVTHWEVWNEADGCTYATCMWDAKWENYIDLYAVVARRLRDEFPDIKIGGPALTSMDRWQMAEKLVERCEKENLPFDFLSFHTYPHKPMVRPSLFEARKMLDRHGFAQAEIHCNEWHYFPCIGFAAIKTPEQRRRWYYTPDGMNGIDAAAFICAQITLWQDAPVDVANYYLTGYTGTCWGLYGVYGEKFPTYHAVKMMGDFMGDSPNRIATSPCNEQVFVLGGVSRQGKKRLLISLYKPDGWMALFVKAAGVPAKGRVKVTTLDSFSEPPHVTEIGYSDSKINLGRTLTSSVRLIEW